MITQSVPFTLTITIDSLLIPPSGGLPGGTVGQAYSASAHAAGGNPPYIFSTVAGLPPGLTMDAQGNIIGTPTQSGTFTITGVVSDTPK